jgi:hypothetical protein
MGFVDLLNPQAKRPHASPVVYPGGSGVGVFLLTGRTDNGSGKTSPEPILILAAR